MRFLGRTGVICETERNSEELSVQWQIRDFFSLSGKGADCYASPEFAFGDATWNLLVYTNGETKKPPSGCVGLYLERKDSGPEMIVQHSLRINGAEGVEKTVEDQCQFSILSPSNGWSHFLPRDVLKNHQKLLMPDGVLTILCSMERIGYDLDNILGIFWDEDSPNEIDGEFRESSTRTGGSQSLNKQNAAVQTDEEFKQTKVFTEENHSSEKQGLEKVVEDFGKLLVSGENSDVTVQVGDVKFSVHKAILSVRSPVLSAMFRHESKEKASNKIIIEDCDPDVFREYLQYLYTGGVQLLTEQNVFGLYRIADKYLADDLQRQCLEHIRDTLSVQTFCDVVQLALTHGENGLLEQAMDFATENIRLIIRSVGWQHFNRDHPAEANEILIKSLGPPS